MPVSLAHPDRFVRRHIGPGPEDLEAMLQVVGASSLDQLVAETIPESIRLAKPLELPSPMGEHELLSRARSLGAKNQTYRSFIGMGYHGTLTPPVILRNVLENPGWYTQYTPYQAEISQGRLEALLNYQTMVMELTGLEIANASLLDEATAAAEAMHMAYAAKGADDRKLFWVADTCHPQTIEVMKTRAEAIGIDVAVGDPRTVDLGALPGKPFGVLVQYPDTYGAVHEWRAFGEKVHAAGALFVMAADPLALALLVPPGELGADIALGSTQRFGVPMGYGGPHAAYFACTKEHVRQLPGRIIGVTEDARGKRALRMALQTREQHIRRERATSNICTAQALLAIVASMYAVYHGPRGLRAIADRVHGATAVLRAGLAKAPGVKLEDGAFFDTLRVAGSAADVSRWHAEADKRRINLRRIDATSLGISLDETVSASDLAQLLSVFGVAETLEGVEKLASQTTTSLPDALRRTSPYLTHAVFQSHHSESEMLRYIKQLESRDLSLTTSMIPLGSCTMKLNATAEMIPVTDPQWGSLHPFAPPSQAQGYAQVFAELEAWLGEITGFAGVSLQPNAGAQGEYAGLLVIRKYLQKQGQAHRTICLIPQSAHGTNPASAVMAGMKVVVVATDAKGNVDLADLEAKAEQHKGELACLMLTYPSTHGVFEEDVKRICAIVHEHGGQVYMDGANMNAQVGLCRPADIGADVCHLNLHKTFCIPHGGGGPGMGPIGVAKHLVDFLPSHPVVAVGGKDPIGPVSAAPWSSASILLISWAYIQMMGAEGLEQATRFAILNANYIAKRVGPHFPVVYTGARGRVAHECIVDVRPFKKSAGIEVDDVAKRLMDYGFHAPTMSFPIPGTLMIEPTESEPKEELDRLCDALIAIRQEIDAVESGKWPREDNPLKHAPHTSDVVTRTEWPHPYTREVAAFPAPWTHARKFWPPVARVNNALGDRKLVCSCPPIEEYL
jgi:glycine dehydrogenase